MSCFPDVWNCGGELADNAAEAFFDMIAGGARDLLLTVSTFWMDVDSPTVATGSGQNWVGDPTITTAQSWLSPAALAIFSVTLGIALVKIAYDTRRAQEGMNAIFRSLAATLAGGLPLLAVTMVLIQFGDEFSPWVLEQASQEDTGDGFGQLLVVAMLGSATGTPNPSGALLLIFLLAILGGIMQCVFMVVRNAALIVLLSFGQVTAAGTATEEGWQRFKRICALVLGFALYKPVAAVIYGIGLKLLGSTQDGMMSAIYGLTVLLMAALALPAVIKFVSPAAAMGSSSAFSGGAAVGAIATGAAMVALAGGGGGGAAAAGGAARQGGGGGGPKPPGGTGDGPQNPGAKDVNTESRSDDSKTGGAKSTNVGEKSDSPGGDSDPPAPSSGDADAAPGPSSDPADAGDRTGTGAGGSGGGSGAGDSSGAGSESQRGAQTRDPGGPASTDAPPEGSEAAQGAESRDVSSSDSGGGQSQGQGQGSRRPRPPRPGGSGAAGRAREAGAQAVQNISRQIDEAGEDTSRE